VNNAQCSYLNKCAGTARFAYNWACARWQEQYEARLKDPALDAPSQYSLRRELNAIKRKQFPWMLDVTKCAVQEAIIDVGRAYANFFSGRAAHPVFHKKGVHDSFRVSSGFFKVQGKKIHLPKCGWIRMRECLRWKDAKLVSVTISRSAERWYAAIVCEVDDTGRSAKEGAHDNTVGIDLGVREYVASDGKRHELPRAYRSSERRLRRAQKSLSRKQKGSKNRERQRRKVARIHVRTTNIRTDWLHKLSADVVASAATIVIEDLNVKGMIKNHHLAKSIADAAFGEFRRQLQYKSEEVGHSVVVADRFYPSSKLCSQCGAKTKRLPLSVRSWTCPVCGSFHDRDLNAAINLKAYAASSAASACGEFLTAGAVVPKGASVSSRLYEAGTERQTYLV
jgi:putative transposase